MIKPPLTIEQIALDEREQIAAELLRAIEALKHPLDDELHSEFLEAVLHELRRPKLPN